jgi:hypothetical protein
LRDQLNGSRRLSLRQFRDLEQVPIALQAVE